MVARAGRYYGEAFKGARGVTQGDPLYPIIFNVVVDAVSRHWVNGLVDEAEEKRETGREGYHQLAVFYADNGMVVSSDPAWLQGEFNALVPGGVRRDDHAVVCIENRRLVTSLPPRFPFFLSLVN